MRYKSESGMPLDRINWGIGVANEILLENASTHTRYNTHMQSIERQTRMGGCTTEQYYP